MLQLLFATLLCVQHVLGGYIPPPPTSTLMVTQQINHMRTGKVGTFKQKILVYDTFYQSSTIPASRRPIIFTCGGEAPVRGGYDHNGFLFEMAKKNGALLVFPEHRYYGDSLPFGSRAHASGNIEFLTIQQALLDFSSNIDYIRKTYQIPATAPLLTVGGSYPGELAAYMRMAFPSQVDAALASSAPIGPRPVPQYGFFRVATEDFVRENPICGTIAREAFTELNKFYAQLPPFLSEVQRSLRLCKQPPSNKQDLIFWVQNAFATLGMENYPYPVGEFGTFPAQEACKKMSLQYVISGGNALEALGVAVGVVYNATGTEKCLDFASAGVGINVCADITGCGTGSDAASWDYQSCTQIINKVGTNNVTDVFPPLPWPEQEITAACQRRWGSSAKMQPFTKLNYTHSSRIIFSNGNYDPWMPSGVLKSPSPGQIITLQMSEAAHHLDLRGSDPADPLSVVQTRKIEEKIINKWLATAYGERKVAQLKKQSQR